MSKREPQIVGLTAQRRLQMYHQYPEALTEEVGRVMQLLADDEDRIKHNAALTRIIELIDTSQKRQAMWRRVARAILDAAQRPAPDEE